MSGRQLQTNQRNHKQDQEYYPPRRDRIAQVCHTNRGHANAANTGPDGISRADRKMPSSLFKEDEAQNHANIERDGPLQILVPVHEFERAGETDLEQTRQKQANPGVH